MKITRHFTALISLFLMQAATFSRTQAPALTLSASLEGIVVEAGSDKPLAKTTLELRSADDAATRRPGVTDSNGRFVFPSIPPGRYMLVASRADYLRSSYGQRETNGSVFVLQSGDRLSNIRLSLIPSATIAGRVLDRDGEPVSNAQMHVLRISYQDGWRMAIPVSSQLTNDVGEYRFWGLPAGQYFVSAQPEPRSFVISPQYDSLGTPLPGAILLNTPGGMMAGTADPANTRQVSHAEWTPVYFGGTTDEFAATPIEAHAGGLYTGIDILAERIPMVSLRGVITGPGGLPVDANIVVTPMAPRNAFATMSNINVIGGNLNVTQRRPLRSGAGQFNTPGLPAGSYIVTAIADQAGQRLSGQTEVRLSGPGPQDVSLALGPAWTIDGRVVVEGGADKLDLKNLSIRLISTVNPIADTPPVKPNADGSFKIPDVGFGRYLFVMTPLSNFMSGNSESIPAGWRNGYVRSVRLGEIDILNEGMSLRGQPDRAMEVVIGTKAARLGGTALNANREIVAKATVVLVPEDSDRIDLYRSMKTDDSGHYQFEGVPPGAYNLFAWDDVEPNSWRDAALMRSIQDYGRAVKAGEGSDQSLELTAIPLR